jgi:pimeloyl-ACP methyl ester carboxylesterase
MACGCGRPRSSSDHGEDVIFILPGVANTTLQMTGLCSVLAEANPRARIEVRPWGQPWRSIHNLQNFPENLETAARFAEELAQLRQAHPHRRLDVVGYSGGAGMALFTVAALPEETHIDRLVLLAAAISPAYQVDSQVLPHITDFVVNFRSPLDVQVGWGTKRFGTMDRHLCYSAGRSGFDVADPRLLEVPWTLPMVIHGHFGNHWSYLHPLWQRRFVAPALNQQLDADGVREALGIDNTST